MSRKTPDDVDWLNAEQAHELFDLRSRELLGLSREEFVRAYRRGDFSGRDEDPGVRDLLALVPFATASSSSA